MKGLFTILFLATLLTVASGQIDIVSVREFSDQIDSIGLKFEMPENYKEAAVMENDDLFYSFANEE